ncbi:type VII secretion target [Nocardia sp. NPDC058658]|uniref:type VII secretion target n=1 Tax=Nocardia sp. NPDC058658 TaxID=3346580 RepID=UPI003647C824
MSLKVDPIALEAWAKWLTGVAEEIKALGKNSILPNISDGREGIWIEGTEWDAVMSEADNAIRKAYNSSAARQEEMATIAAGAKNDYEITDNTFAERLKSMGGLA